MPTNSYIKSLSQTCAQSPLDAFARSQLIAIRFDVRRVCLLAKHMVGQEKIELDKAGTRSATCHVLARLQDHPPDLLSIFLVGSARDPTSPLIYQMSPTIIVVTAQGPLANVLLCFIDGDDVLGFESWVPDGYSLFTPPIGSEMTTRLMLSDARRHLHRGGTDELSTAERIIREAFKASTFDTFDDVEVSLVPANLWARLSPFLERVSDMVNLTLKAAKADTHFSVKGESCFAMCMETQLCVCEALLLTSQLHALRGDLDAADAVLDWKPLLGSPISVSSFAYTDHLNVARLDLGIERDHAGDSELLKRVSASSSPSSLGTQCVMWSRTFPTGLLTVVEKAMAKEINFKVAHPSSIASVMHSADLLKVAGDGLAYMYEMAKEMPPESAKVLIAGALPIAHSVTTLMEVASKMCKAVPHGRHPAPELRDCRALVNAMIQLLAPSAAPRQPVAHVLESLKEARKVPGHSKRAELLRATLAAFTVDDLRNDDVHGQLYLAHDLVGALVLSGQRDKATALMYESIETHLHPCAGMALPGQPTRPPWETFASSLLADACAVLVSRTPMRAHLFSIDSRPLSPFGVEGCDEWASFHEAAPLLCSLRAALRIADAQLRDNKDAQVATSVEAQLKRPARARMMSAFVPADKSQTNGIANTKTAAGGASELFTVSQEEYAAISAALDGADADERAAALSLTHEELLKSVPKLLRQARANGAGRSPAEHALERFVHVRALDSKLSAAMKANVPEDAGLLALAGNFLDYVQEAVDESGAVPRADADLVTDHRTIHTKGWAASRSNAHTSHEEVHRITAVSFKPGLHTTLVVGMLQKASMLTRLRASKPDGGSGGVAAAREREVRTERSADRTFERARIVWRLQDEATDHLGAMGLSTALLDAAVGTVMDEVAHEMGFHRLAAQRVLLTLGGLAAMLQKCRALVERCRQKAAAAAAVDSQSFESIAETGASEGGSATKVSKKSKKAAKERAATRAAPEAEKPTVHEDAPSGPRHSSPCRKSGELAESAPSPQLPSVPEEVAEELAESAPSPQLPSVPQEVGARRVAKKINFDQGEQLALETPKKIRPRVLTGRVNENRRRLPHSKPSPLGLPALMSLAEAPTTAEPPADPDVLAQDKMTTIEHADENAGAEDETSTLERNTCVDSPRSHADAPTDDQPAPHTPEPIAEELPAATEPRRDKAEDGGWQMVGGHKRATPRKIASPPAAAQVNSAPLGKSPPAKTPPRAVHEATHEPSEQRAITPLTLGDMVMKTRGKRGSGRTRPTDGIRHESSPSDPINWSTPSADLAAPEVPPAPDEAVHCHWDGALHAWCSPVVKQSPCKKQLSFLQAAKVGVSAVACCVEEPAPVYEPAPAVVPPEVEPETAPNVTPPEGEDSGEDEPNLIQSRLPPPKRPPPPLRLQAAVERCSLEHLALHHPCHTGLGLEAHSTLLRLGPAPFAQLLPTEFEATEYRLDGLDVSQVGDTSVTFGSMLGDGLVASGVNCAGGLIIDLSDSVLLGALVPMDNAEEAPMKAAEAKKAMAKKAMAKKAAEAKKAAKAKQAAAAIKAAEKAKAKAAKAIANAEAVKAKANAAHGKVKSKCFLDRSGPGRTKPKSPHRWQGKRPGALGGQRLELPPATTYNQRLEPAKAREREAEAAFKAKVARAEISEKVAAAIAARGGAANDAAAKLLRGVALPSIPPLATPLIPPLATRLPPYRPCPRGMPSLLPLATRPT